MPVTPPPGDRPRADSRRNRDLILDAAAVALARDATTSLAAIAEAAGLSRATAYRHFPDVDAIRAALLEEAEQVGRSVLQDQLPAILGDDADPHEPVLDQVVRLLRLALPMRHRWTIAISNEPVSDEALVKAFAPLTSAFLRRGQARGEFRDDLDLDLVSEALVSLALYAVRRVHADGLSVDQGLAIVRPYLHGLAPPPGRASVPAD